MTFPEDGDPSGFKHSVLKFCTLLPRTNDLYFLSWNKDGHLFCVIADNGVSVHMLMYTPTNNVLMPSQWIERNSWDELFRNGAIKYAGSATLFTWCLKTA
jgi:hypothetical protein